MDNIITDGHVAQADAEAIAAEAARAQAEAAYAKGTARPDLYRAYDAAILTATHAAARARVLRAEQAEQQTRLTARADAEKAAEKELAGAAKKLTASRDSAVQAVAEAERAVRVALAAVGEHDQLVRAVSDSLRGRGLRLDDGGESGGDRDGSLRVSGEDWHPIDAPSLLSTVLRSVVAATNPRHPLGRAAGLTYGGPSSARGTAALLAQVRQAR